MGLDVDWIGGRNRLGQIKELFAGLPHGERAWMADRIDEFYDSLEREILIKKSESHGAKHGIVESPQELASLPSV
jgi:hypothetical protein